MSAEQLCLLDQDGVTADFMKGVQKLFGIPQSTFDSAPRPIPWNWIWEVLGLNEKEFWSYITIDWWADLDWMPDGKAILEIVESHFGPENVVILTNPSGQDSAYPGKKIWFERHMPKYARDQRYIFAKHKRACANAKHWLIDDADHNVKDFRDAGGKAILCPRLWNQLHSVTDAASYIRSQLNEQCTIGK